MRRSKRFRVSISVLVRHSNEETKGKIFYHKLEDYSRKEEKYRELNKFVSVAGVPWSELHPDKRNNWLNESEASDFDQQMPISDPASSKFDNAAKAVFRLFSLGVATNRDAWAYNFSNVQLEQNIKLTLDTYEIHRGRWAQRSTKDNVDSFVDNDPTKISWTDTLKDCLRKGRIIDFQDSEVRTALRRPYSKQYLYFDKYLNQRRYQFHRIFPTPETESENVIIAIKGLGMERDFHALASNHIVDLQFTPNGQCFPFYVYDEDGSNRRENITDWAVAQFKLKLQSLKLKGGKGKEITKWDIFYYIYGLLHHPEYRKKYAANLRRELPRIPLAPDFWAYSEAGKKLADLHVNYEEAAEYNLEEEWKEGSVLDLRVEKMKLKKPSPQPSPGVPGEGALGTTAERALEPLARYSGRGAGVRADLIYNDKFTLRGIPPEVFDYKLGNRSALDWIIDQYQVSTDKRSGITNDPNREDEPDYIVKLIRKVITVSLETVKIVSEIEKLKLE